MPYVKNEYRYELSNSLNKLRNTIIKLSEKDVCGILNYVITDLLTVVPDQLNDGTWNYSTINSAVGVLECAKQELYRRLAAPYEDKCINRNGDVSIYEREKLNG